MTVRSVDEDGLPIFFDRERQLWHYGEGIDKPISMTGYSERASHNLRMRIRPREGDSAEAVEAFSDKLFAKVSYLLGHGRQVFISCTVTDEGPERIHLAEPEEEDLPVEKEICVLPEPRDDWSGSYDEKATAVKTEKDGQDGGA